MSDTSSNMDNYTEPLLKTKNEELNDFNDDVDDEDPNQPKPMREDTFKRISEIQVDMRGSKKGSFLDRLLGRNKADRNIPREFVVGNGWKPKFRSNSVHTNRYSWLFFVPKNLFEQFTRIANIYFGFIALLQLIFHYLSPTGRFSTAIPLTVVITFSAIKDAFEDWKRRMGDFEVNQRKVTILKNGKWKEIRWKNLRVGQIVKIKNKEKFPSDLIILSTSEEQGLCYIETSSLDGETNLKIRRARPETNFINSEIEASQFSAKVTCEQPNKALYKFEGSITITENGEEKVLGLDPEQILLRGSTLRNTNWVIAIAVFTGHETKLMKNQKKQPHKKSKLERMTNKMILIILLVLFTLCVISTILFLVSIPRYDASKYWYFKQLVNPNLGQGRILKNFFEGLVTFIILYNNLVPISLYVSVEVAKFIQGTFMGNDIKMYHEEGDIPCVVRNSSLNEELGQVQYIFSDKTGTLTCNKMEFLKFSVNGVPYGTGHTEIERSNALRKGIELVDDRPPGWKPVNSFKFFDERISNLAWKDHEDYLRLREFFILLGVCHTVIPEKQESGKIIYQAASPDEAALVKAAAELGVKFIERTTDTITIDVAGKIETYSILNVLEFTSKRKRMSVIVRDPDGRLMLFMKGADNVIFPLLSKNDDEKIKTEELLDEFADAGLRTLVCAKAAIDEVEYVSWNEKFQEAKCSFVNRTKKLEEVNEAIEKNLQLIGVTAIEDELQEGVPETISDLAKAGIKIWVLTGDKQSTAINIGFACDLLNNDMGIIILEGFDPDSLHSQLTKNLSIASRSKDSSEVLGLVVEGKTLTTILETPALKSMFLKLGVQCRSVVCCRVSPSQKAEVVKLVRSSMSKITLSIGDGANDVPMILQAHVGVGIAGEEGLQAANSSDYSIGQFRFLKRLLLVHGRWSYRRVSKLILYSFYKNIVLYLTQMWYVLFNFSSGTSMHDRHNVGTYNIFFTALPIMALAIFDRDIKDEVAEAYPELYRQGHQDRFFCFKVFIGYLANAVFHSGVCFWLPLLCLYTSNEEFRNGQTMDMFSLGICVYTSVLLVVTLKCALETWSFTFIHIGVIILSLLLWISWVFAYSSLGYLNYMILRTRDKPTNLGLFDSDFIFLTGFDTLQQYRGFLSLEFYCTVLLTTVVALLRDYVHKCGKRIWNRNLYYKVQKSGLTKDRQEILKSYPLEDGIPSFQKQIKVEISELKKIFDELTGGQAKYRGFAFSATQGEAEYLDEHGKNQKKEQNVHKWR